MHVLFLALGATRKRAVLDESARVAAGGGRALVVIDSLDRWRRPVFADGVEVVDLAVLDRFAWLERTALYRIPRYLARRVGRWKLRGPVHKVRRGYEKLIANPLHGKLFLPVYRRWMFRAAPRLIARRVLPGKAVDVLVVAEPRAMPVAVTLLDGYAGWSGRSPDVAYSLEHSGLEYPGMEDHVRATPAHSERDL